VTGHAVIVETPCSPEAHPVLAEMDRGYVRDSKGRAPKTVTGSRIVSWGAADRPIAAGEGR